MPLVLLDTSSCEALALAGNSEVRILANGNLPGAIAVDSDGSGCKDKSAVVEAAGNAVVQVDGTGAKLLSHARAVRPENAVRVTGNAIVPSPAANPVRHGRAVVDARYGQALADLRSRWAGSGLPDPTFQRWTTFVAASRPFVKDPCSLDGATALAGLSLPGFPYPVSVPPGNWYIDCPKGLKLEGSGNVVFRGGNIVMDEPIEMKDTVRLGFNCPSGAIRRTTVAPARASLPDCGSVVGDSIVVVRSGNTIEGDGHVVLWPRTFVYTPEGTADLSGGHDLYWSAPLAGSFRDLLLWTDSSASIDLDKYGATELEGILFAPASKMKLTGSKSLENQRVQLFLRTLEMTGNTKLSTRPVADRHISVNVGGASTVTGGEVSLIR